MPNWCSNVLTLTHKDPEQIKRAQKALVEGDLLKEFVPVPQELQETVSPAPENAPSVVYDGREYTSWYDFCVSEWGTKWDVDAWSNEVSEDGLTLECSFDSAWAPPIAWYNKMEELGFGVTAYYNEPGMAFVGKYQDGYDEYYEYQDEDSNTVRDVIGEELDDMFAISENMAEWEQDNEE